MYLTMAAVDVPTAHHVRSISHGHEVAIQYPKTGRQKLARSNPVIDQESSSTLGSRTTATSTQLSLSRGSIPSVNMTCSTIHSNEVTSSSSSTSVGNSNGASSATASNNNNNELTNAPTSNNTTINKLSISLKSSHQSANDGKSLRQSNNPASLRSSAMSSTSHRKTYSADVSQVSNRSSVKGSILEMDMPCHPPALTYRASLRFIHNPTTLTQLTATQEDLEQNDKVLSLNLKEQSSENVEEIELDSEGHLASNRSTGEQEDFNPRGLSNGSQINRDQGMEGFLTQKRRRFENGKLDREIDRGKVKLEKEIEKIGKEVGKKKKTVKKKTKKVGCSSCNII